VTRNAKDYQQNLLVTTPESKHYSSNNMRKLSQNESKKRHDSMNSNNECDESFIFKKD